MNIKLADGSTASVASTGLATTGTVLGGVGLGLSILNGGLGGGQKQYKTS